MLKKSVSLVIFLLGVVCLAAPVSVWAHSDDYMVGLSKPSNIGYSDSNNNIPCIYSDIRVPVEVSSSLGQRETLFPNNKNIRTLQLSVDMEDSRCRLPDAIAIKYNDGDTEFYCSLFGTAEVSKFPVTITAKSNASWEIWMWQEEDFRGKCLEVEIELSETTFSADEIKGYVQGLTSERTLTAAELIKNKEGTFLKFDLSKVDPSILKNISTIGLELYPKEGEKAKTLVIKSIMKTIGDSQVRHDAAEAIGKIGKPAVDAFKKGEEPLLK